MSLTNNFVRNTHFVAGFSFKGKRTTDVGEDLLTATGINVETMDGTPVVFNGDMNTVAVAGDGVKPDAYLYSRISEELTDMEWLVSDIMRDEVKPGDPFTIVLAKPYGIIETNLVDNASTITAGDDLYVASGVLSATDPIDPAVGSGVVVGTAVESDGAEFVKVLLK